MPFSLARSLLFSKCLWIRHFPPDSSFKHTPHWLHPDISLVRGSFPWQGVRLIKKISHWTREMYSWEKKMRGGAAFVRLIFFCPSIDLSSRLNKCVSCVLHRRQYFTKLFLQLGGMDEKYPLTPVQFASLDYLIVKKMSMQNQTIKPQTVQWKRPLYGVQNNLLNLIGLLQPVLYNAEIFPCREINVAYHYEWYPS